MMSSKEKTLSYLKNRIGEFVSGEELSRKIFVSRTAIWKHIQSLRKNGYEIKAVPNVGYMLKKLPDLLLPSEISSFLRTDKFGRSIHYYKEIGSTNDLAKKLAFNNAEEGTIVVAEEQKGGRGRLGRKWISPYGGIWFSIILRPKINPVDASKITLLAAIVTANVIIDLTGLKVKIKWPNDLLIEGRKLAGILTEMDAEFDKIDFLVLGIGINANIDLEVFPSDFRNKLTSLKAQLNKNIDRKILLAGILNELEKNYLDFLNGPIENSFLKIIQSRWNQLDGMAGNNIKVMISGEVVEGIAKGIDNL
ncbi:MAG: biotin--[acetyl-CoA-carboxylase] ligase [Actinobacteria bacterium]|nr:biotin--[acetyl-CoA-carboxylase] ligase [Actinomycetota bacterium]